MNPNLTAWRLKIRELARMYVNCARSPEEAQRNCSDILDECRDALDAMLEKNRKPGGVWARMHVPDFVYGCATIEEPVADERFDRIEALARELGTSFAMASDALASDSTIEDVEALFRADAEQRAQATADDQVGEVEEPKPKPKGKGK